MAEGGEKGCETQKKEIAALLQTALKKGDTWYLIDTKWFKQWKKYVGYDNWDTSYVGEKSAYPGPIDNAPLLKEDTNDMLKEHLIDELDYMLVPEKAWNLLVSWYNIVEGQVPLARSVIEQGMFVKHCKVEVYLMDLKLCQSGSNMDEVVTKQFSRADTIDSIEKEIRKLFSIADDKEARLWNKYMSNTYEPLNKPDNTVQDAGLYQGQVIVIEQKNDDGTWPRQSKMPSSSIYSCQQSTSSGSGSLEINSISQSVKSTGSYSSGGYTPYYGGSYDGCRSSVQPGLCGLSNLGNTCFMNSAIQCMSNVPALTEYFLNGEWKNELNYENPLGMRGEIATRYAKLIENIWSGKYSYTVPRDFKVAVGQFAPTFSGYQQQDSQELMAFLLDGLHEDLNRIKKKPYVELKSADGRQDEEVAAEAWVNYRKRNDSVIVDTFHGLLKSTLVCPECNKVSVTFDPFCYLSLPLPIKKERHIEIFFIPLEPMSKCRRFKLTVPKMGTVLDLCKSFTKLTKIPTDRMVVTDVYNHRFHKVFSQEDGLNQIQDRDDIFIYEVPVTSPDDPETLVLPLYMREKKARQDYTSYHGTWQLFGQPLLLPVPRKCNYDVLYNCVLNRMARYVKRPDESIEWWKTSQQKNQEVNGEIEMNDEEEENGDTESRKTSSEEESLDGTASEGDDKPLVSKRSEDTPQRLFTFHMVNSYGSTEMDGIRDDGKPIKFSNRSYVAMDWHPKAKERFYDDRAAEEFETDESMTMRSVTKRQVIQLSQCLDLFTTNEKLGEQDLWYCPQCRMHRQATKKFDLWKLPHILVIHLKRFSYNRYWRDKLDTLIEYPTRGFNMREWLINPHHDAPLYDLIAVSNHYGGMGGGHYTAYGKNKEDNQWFYFDDSNVSQASEDNVVTKAGYVLVYQRREQKASQVNQSPSKTCTTTSTDSNYDNNEVDMDVN